MKTATPDIKTTNDDLLLRIASAWGVVVMCGYLLFLPVFITGEAVRQLYRYILSIRK